MTPPGRTAAFDIDHRTLRRLFDCYLLFIVYASFIPFIFNLDPNFIQWRLDIFFSRSLFRGVQRWSGSDIATNVLIYIPLGILLAGSWRQSHLASRSPVAPFVFGFAGLLLGFTIELGQTLCPFRSPSMLDALCNGVGTFIGALLSYPLFPAFNGVLGARMVGLLRRQSVVVLIAYVLLAPLVDALYPFEFKITIASVANGFSFSKLTFIRNGIPWLDLLFEKFVAFTVLGYLVATYNGRKRAPFKIVVVIAICGALAFGTEAVKLLTGRLFHAAAWLLALCGSTLGVVLERRLPYGDLSTSRNLLILAILAVGLLSYFQWEPFDWISRGELSWKVFQIEWSPLASYYWSDPRAALFDFLKKLHLSIPIGYLLSAHWDARSHLGNARALVTVMFIGLALEASQIMIRSRTPSITDVMTIAIGGWLGIQFYRFYHSIVTLNETTSD